MDSIEFIKKELGVPRNEDLSEHFGTKMPTDRVIRLVQKALNENWYTLESQTPPNDEVVMFADSESGGMEAGVYGGTMPPKYYHDNYDHWKYKPLPPQK